MLSHLQRRNNLEYVGLAAPSFPSHPSVPALNRLQPGTDPSSATSITKGSPKEVIVVFFENLSQDKSADGTAVHDFLQGRVLLLGGSGFLKSGANKVQSID